MALFIPRQTKLTRERLEARLESSLVTKFEYYCQYLDSDRDYVLSQLLELIFRKDKAFVSWLEQQDHEVSARQPNVGSRKRTVHGSSDTASDAGSAK